jgi:hypothetical protein
MGASKVGGGWQESINNNMTTTASNNAQCECAVGVEGSNKRARAARAMVNEGGR